MLKEALLYERLDGRNVRCNLCAHRCHIPEGQKGFCMVRENREGILYSLIYAQVAAAHIDPIEKKPLYHFLPGSESFSLATAGCNFRCGFCQNWQISQAKDKTALSQSRQISPQELVDCALEEKCRSISYTYTEPTIFFEYALDTARLAEEKGLYNIFVTNGYMTKDALRIIAPYLDAANIDLKSFREPFYRQHCKAHLAPVLETIKHMKEAGIWIEATTLVIPGENDSEPELKSIAAFIADISKDIPWHVSKFHPDYTLNDRRPTPAATLEKAYDYGKEAGLFYVYLGNVAQGNDTYCPSCSKKIIKRSYFNIVENHIANGSCAFCSHPISGVFK